MIFNIPLPKNKIERLKVIQVIQSMDSVHSCAHSPKIFSFDVENLDHLEEVMLRLENEGLSGIELSSHVSVGQATSSIKRTSLGLVRLL